MKKSAKKVRGKWAATSINPMLARTRSVFSALMDQGVLVRNVAALVKPLVTDEKKMVTLTVTAARLATAGGATTGAPKTKTSVRTLPMPDDLAAALRRFRMRQAESKLRLGSKWADSGYLVVDELGVAPYPDTLTAAWRKALSNAGLPHVRLHDARHSCATLMHLNGVPTVVVAAWLGHQDPGFTLRTYAHSSNDALAQAAAMLGSITTGKKKDTTASGT